MSRDDPMLDEQERPNLDVRLIFGVAGAVLLLVFVVVGVTFWFYRWQVPQPIVIVPKVFPQPRVMEDPSLTLRRQRARERERLYGYAWVDRKAGIISIPIDQAMPLIAARGANAYAPVINVPPQKPEAQQ